MKLRNGIVVLVTGLWVGLSGCSKKQQGAAPLVSNLTITEIAGYQALKTTLMKDGAAASPEVPIIAGKPMTLRAFVAPLDGYDGREVVVRFELTSGGITNAIEVKQAFGGASSEGDFASTANLDLTAEQVTADLTFAVSLRETKKSKSTVENPGAIYPPEGEIALGIKETGDQHIVVLPIQYNADGSGRMPDTSPAMIESLRARMRAFYPVRDVQITVADPISFTRQISADGGNWDRLLETVLRKRYDDGVDNNVYYYGMFQPADSFEEFCGYGCVLGLSLGAPDEDTAWVRGSIGLGYPDKESESDITFVHEIGHAHGRDHAPCGGAQGVDRSFPYKNGGIGVWGFDATTKTLLDPQGEMRDMMGYCAPAWVSDYTYNALYDRITYVNNVPQVAKAHKRWRTVIVNDKGATKGGLIAAPSGGKVAYVERETETQVEQIEARFFPFDHLPGGMLLVPEDEADSVIGTLSFRGVTIQ